MLFIKIVEKTFFMPYNENMINFKLKEIREKNKLTQQQVADKINMSRQVFSRYERSEREPDFETLIKLARFFNVSIDYLLGLENEDGTKNY